MREIKFRAWHKEWSPKEINESDWHTKGQKVNGMKFVKSLGYGNRRFWVHLEDWKSAISADDVHLMQYTGLHDKNGKEIYEEDVVQWKADNEGREYLMRQDVRFVDGAFGIPTAIGQVNLPFYQDKELEIIGNIYENQELLNPTKV